jgi:hypothetical protein
MGLNAKVEQDGESNEEDAQINAMIAIEESIEEEEASGPAFLDEDAYVTEIVIGGELLEDELASCRIAELEEKAERISEEEAIRAMKALKVLDDEQDEVIFDTGCTAHVLKSGEGLFDLRKAPVGSCIKGVGGTATITHIGKMLGIGRVFVAPEGANLISVSQLAESGASFSGDSKEFVVRDKNETVMFKARPSQNHRGLYVMNGEDFRKACAEVSARMITYFSDFEDGVGMRQSYTMTWEGLVKRTHFNADTIGRAKAARELHRCMGHPSDTALGNALDNGAYPELNITSRDLVAAADYYGACNACLEGKMVSDPERTSDKEPVREIGEYVSVDLLPAKTRSLGGNSQMIVSRDRLSSYVMCVPIKSKETSNVLGALSRINNFYRSYGHRVKRFVFDNEAVFHAVQRDIDYAECTYTPTDLHNKHVERLVRELKEKWRCMRADLPYILPDFLNFEGLMAAAETINCLPNTQTGPTRTAVEIMTGRKPFARPFRFGQAGLSHVKRPDSPDTRAEWCMFLTSDLFNPKSVRVYVPEYRTVVSRKKFRATEGYPDTWNYVKKPGIIPIPREEKGSPNDAIRVDEDEEKTVSEPADGAVEEEQSAITPIEENRHQMTLRSHTRSNNLMSRTDEEHGPENLGNIPESFVGEKSAVPSDRDFYEYLPARQPFYNRQEVKEETDYPFETFTHQAYCALVYAHRMSVKQAMNQQDEKKRTESQKAIEAEIKQLMDIKAFLPTKWETINEQTRKKIIPSHMFLKEKLLANGEFDRMKARLVAGGNFVDARSVGETNAPTVNPFTVFFMLNVAAQYRLEILTADIKGAYLIPDIVEGSEPDTYLWIEKTLTEIFVKLYPELKQYVNPSGRLVFKLRKYLYGLPQAAFHFHQHLSDTMRQLGFTQLTSDRCMWKRGEGTMRVYVCAHVDDLMAIGRPEALQAFERDIKTKYEITVQRGYKHSYIGLDITQLRGSMRIVVSQKGFHKELLSKYSEDIKTIRPSKTPCDETITNDPPDADVEFSKEKYAGAVMSLMWLSRLTRCDIAFAVNVCSRRCRAPTSWCWKHILKILSYLERTGVYGILYEEVPRPRFILSCDASHGIYPSGRGQQMVILTWGSGVVSAYSRVIKLITLSTTESEHMAVNEGCTLGMHAYHMANEMGLKINDKILIYQDNTSTIWLTANEGNFVKNRHIRIRRNFVKEQVIRGKVEACYQPTDKMIADIGTKPVTSTVLERHMDAMNMVKLKPLAN